MDPLTISAASGLRSRLESLEMLANNLSNAGTSGYKTDREFYSLYVSPEAGGAEPATVPVVERSWIDFSSGPLRTTGNSFDFALDGKGFFAVNGASGPLYTRNGSFRLSSDGTLVASGGFPVRLAGGGTLRARPEVPLEVNADGSVSQAGQALGQLEIVDFTDRAGLAKQGDTYFRTADAPAPAANVAVRQGQLEDSNSGGPEGAVRLVSLMRQFEMLQRAVTLGGEMNRRAVEEVARVGS
jgi:flagellar basal-body rod protein FlgF